MLVKAANGLQCRLFTDIHVHSSCGPTYIPAIHTCVAVSYTLHSVYAYVVCAKASRGGSAATALNVLCIALQLIVQVLRFVFGLHRAIGFIQLTDHCLYTTYSSARFSYYCAHEPLWRLH
jgi:hypothetical protein